ncbi:MAG: LemA family protein [Patescibacteria group bacterium]|jgi:LemA protein
MADKGKIMMIFVWVLIAILAIAIIWVIAAYNGLITLRNRTQEAWSDIDVQLKRRYDLIPNLVNTVKGYATHEKGVFEKVTQARANALNAEKAGDIAGSAKAENMLSGALKSLFAVAEAYPDLKANQNFLDLQQQLADTEDKIQASRRFYNGNVRDFNTKQEVFPTNVIANMFAFKPAAFFEIENEVEKKNVEVKF